MKKSVQILVIVFLLCCITYQTGYCQVGINSDNSEPVPSAMLDVKSTDKGILIPRMSSTERENINAPEEGLLVYDNTSQSFWYYKNATWTEITDSKLTETEVDAFVENNGYITDPTDGDASSTNELQDLSLVENVLRITNHEAPTLIDLSPYMDDTKLTETEVDDFVSNNGYITNANDADADPTNEMELPETDGTDGQFLQTDGNGSVSWATHSDNIEDADADPTNEIELPANNGTDGQFLQTDGAGNVSWATHTDNVEDADADPTNEIELPANNGTDGQFLQTDGAGNVSWATHTDNVDDADADPTNEIELPANNGTDGQFLQTDGAGNVSWATHTDNVNDADANASNELQTLSFIDPNLSISNGNSVNLSALLDDEDWVTSSGTNITNGNDGNVGIGNIAATQNRWQLTVKDDVDCMLGADSVDVSELFAVFTRNLNENNTGVGIGFQSTSTVTGMGAAIVHERTNSNSRGKLHFATKSSGSAADEDLPIRMTLNEEGRLGIGITAPTEKLHISGGDILADRKSTTSSLTRTLTLGGARNGDSTFGRIDFQNYDSNNGLADYVGASIQANNGGDNTDNGNLRFFTYNGTLTEQMRITESGEVGIGETAPQASLDVVDQAVIGNVNVGSESTDQGTSVAAGDGFAVTPWLYTNAIEAQGERGSASTLITVGADGTYGVADEIHLVTSGNSQLTVANDGKIGLDEQDPNTDIHIRQSQQSITNGTGGVKFETSSDAADWWRIFHSGIYFSFNLQGDRVAYVNTNGAWTVDSDRRLKKNISKMQPTLSRLMQMRPVEYRYKNQNNSAGKTLGFIAQEVQPLFPEMVVEGEDGKLGMTYATTGVIAVKAIQEQQEIIEEQQEEIEDLKQQNTELEQRLKLLEEAVKKLQKK